MSRTLVCPVVFVAFVVGVPAVAAGQDAVKVSASMYTVLLENEHVRVLEFRCKAGEKEAMHSHPAGVAYLATAAKYRATLEGGKPEEGEGKAGTAVWMEPVTHEWECLNDHRTIITEMKRSRGTP